MGGEGDAPSRLESILTDTSAPLGECAWAAGSVELRLLVRLAAPVVVVYMINYVMSMSTHIFSGHLGNLELAAASLRNTALPEKSPTMTAKTMPTAAVGLF
ncbi:protein DETOXIFICATION 40-like [Triticum dicoccoides]|uniref:protein DETOXIFICATION 40-like n=1 Tax=Triticum dicoccoides TaxID=85692 RepID=UPI00188EB4C1|nr:protein DETOXIFICATION 40-like [Triticum dicoccoides]